MTEREATLNEVVALLRNLPSLGMYRLGGGYHAPSYDDAWRVAALEVAALGRKSSQWTTEPPTEPGMYWAVPRDRPPPTPIVVYVDIAKTFSCVDTIGTDVASEIAHFSHWLRIEAPEPPK